MADPNAVSQDWVVYPISALDGQGGIDQMPRMIRADTEAEALAAGAEMFGTTEVQAIPYEANTPDLPPNTPEQVADFDAYRRAFGGH